MSGWRLSRVAGAANNEVEVISSGIWLSSSDPKWIEDTYDTGLWDVSESHQWMWWSRNRPHLWSFVKCQREQTFDPGRKMRSGYFFCSGPQDKRTDFYCQKGSSRCEPPSVEWWWVMMELMLKFIYIYILSHGFRPLSRKLLLVVPPCLLS